MHWISEKISTLTGTIIAAVMGALTSQAVAFTHAYLQRLGGHIDEARKTLSGLTGGDIGRAVADPGSREKLMVAFQARIADLEAARNAISESGVFTKPFVLLANLDRDIALGTANGFTPAVPLDLPSLVYALAGMIIGLLVWDGVKAPFSRRRGSGMA
jgi:hypothetical protein